jgi:DNA-binding NarL/FixJ family response regulator
MKRAARKVMDEKLQSTVIRVVLADDHPLIRDGIRSILHAEGDISVVGEAGHNDEVLQRCLELSPDVLLLDLNMPGPATLEVISQIRAERPATKVMILTGYEDDGYIRALVAAGVCGYVLKGEASSVVVRAIRAVAQGDTWLSRPVVEKLIQEKNALAPLSILTPREQEILAMIGRGWSNARIATELMLSEQTIRNKASQIYTKLGLSSRAEAILWLHEQEASKS